MQQKAVYLLFCTFTRRILNRLFCVTSRWTIITIEIVAFIVAGLIYVLKAGLCWKFKTAVSASLHQIKVPYKPYF